jgi:hypothetical protein
MERSEIRVGASIPFFKGDTRANLIMTLDTQIFAHSPPAW